MGRQKKKAYHVSKNVGTSLVVAFVVLIVSLRAARADGDLDVTFGNGGRVQSDLGFQARALAMQPDGKIIVGGEGEFSFAIARYNPDGTLDLTFGSGGKVSPDISFSYASVRALSIQADGKILAAGEAISVSPRSYGALLARYTSNGVLDATFGTDGKV